MGSLKNNFGGYWDIHSMWPIILVKSVFNQLAIQFEKWPTHPSMGPIYNHISPPPGCACIISNQFYWDWSIECDFNSVCIHIHRVFGVTYQSKPTSTDHGNIYGLHWCYLLPITCISKKKYAIE